MPKYGQIKYGKNWKYGITKFISEITLAVSRAFEIILGARSIANVELKASKPFEVSCSASKVFSVSTSAKKPFEVAISAKGGG